MFIDEAIVYIEAGNGGNGCVSFRREKFIPKGGPDGGNGGRGGNIIFQADPQKKTLIDYYRNPHQKAENGKGGSGSKKNGKNGTDLYLKVPVGTIIEDVGNGIILADLDQSEKMILVAKGGLGGKGNFHFKNSVQRAPKFAQKGEIGEKKTIRLNLKLIADAALIGFPNVGKSTILTKISAAKPKIADYPFTTLKPYLGIVGIDGCKQIIVADIPGLIEGASKGVGLGIQFLKHIERTKMLIHVIDGTSISIQDIYKKYNIIRNELKEFSVSLYEKPELIVLNKCDIPDVRDKKDSIKKVFSKKDKKLHFISAITGEGLDELIELIFNTIELIDKNKKKELEQNTNLLSNITHYQYRPLFSIKQDKGLFIIEGDKIEKLAHQFDLDNPQALKYFHEKLKSLRVEKALIKKGAKEGDIVKIGEKEFYFLP